MNKDMTLIDSVHINIFQKDPERKPLDWLSFDDVPRVHEKQQK